MAADDRSVRWGIVGTARIAASAFIPAVKATTRGRLAAVASRSGDKAAAFARQHGIEQAYGSYSDLLADPDIDAVYIPVPNSEHREWVMRAAEAGKPIFCEKPAGVTAADAAAMIGFCMDRGMPFFEAFVYRCHPQTAAILNWLQDGVIGEFVSTITAFQSALKSADRPDDVRWQPELGGGALLDLGCYTVNWARLVGGPVKRLVSRVVESDRFGVDEGLEVLLEYAESGSGVMRAGFDAVFGQGAVIYGTEGAIEVALPFHPRGPAATVTLHRRGRETEVHRFAADEPPFRCAVDEFHDLVLDGKPLTVPVDDALGNMEVIDAIRRSDAEGGWVTPE